MPKPFEHNGQRYEWSYEQNDYLPVDQDAGLGSAISSQLGAGLLTGVNAVNELFGYDELAQRTSAAQEEQVARSGALTSQVGPGQAARMVGEFAPYAAVGAATAGAGTLPMMAAEGAAGFAFTPGDLGSRTAAAALAAGTAGTIPGAVALGRSVGKGVRAERMMEAVKNIHKSTGDYLESRRIFREGPRPAEQGGSTVGAAQTTPGRPGELFLDEAEEIFPSMTPAQRNLVAGDTGPAGRMAARRDEATYEGIEARIANEDDFGKYFMKEITPKGSNITRDFTKQGIRDSLDDIGEAMNEIEASMPDVAVPPEIRAMAAEMAADRPEAAFTTLANQMDGSFKNAQQQIRRQIDRFDRAQMYDARDALMTLKSEMDEALNLPPEYKELQRQYAIGMAALDNEVVMGGGGAFNVKSLVNRISKNYKPFRHGVDDSTFGRALRTMQTLQQRQIAGSPTAERLTQGLLNRAGGLLGL